MTDKDLASLQEARDLVRKAKAAQLEFSALRQEQVDQILKAICDVMVAMAEDLARMASEETGFGKWQDKTQKNLLASESLHKHIRNMKTIGVINEDRENRVIQIATPVGVIAALIPSTNPTSTTIYKILIALKAGNGIVFSPHPSAQKCIARTVEIARRVLKEAGVPEDLISMMTIPTIGGTAELMKRADLVLATGGPAMVKAAYSSGTPALGVGPGNVPVFIERTADIPSAISMIMASKTFDNGTVCASEQAVVTEEVIASRVKEELIRQGGYFLEGEKAEKIKAIMERPTGGMNPAIVGRDAQYLANMAGINIPVGTRLLIYEEQGVGPEYPFSSEKLTALIAFYTVSDWQAASDLCIRLLKNGGTGHSLAIHSKNEDVILRMSMVQPVSRILINTPATHGAVGISTGLAPSLTLGCGSIGGSSTSDNVGPLHLFNVRSVAYGLDTAVPQQTGAGSVDVELITRLVLERMKSINTVPAYL
jgi:acetaldehyde dehydrogenase (acetylating)